MRHILLGGLLLASLAAAQTSRSHAPVAAMRVKGNVYLIYGAGPNITAQIGDQIVTLVDAGPAAVSEEVRAAIRAISGKPIGFVIQTSADEERVSGTESLAKDGFFFLESANQNRPQASIVAHLNALKRMSAKDSGYADGIWPTDTYDDTDWQLYANGEAIIVEHPEAAHSDADSFVFFRGSDVVSTGAIFDMTGYPVIDTQHGGSLGGILKALNHILRNITVAENNEQGGTMIVPGRGHVCDRNDLANYRDMLTIIRDRILDEVKKGKTLEQVKTSKPTFDYDGGYGVENGPWTTDMFIEAVYRELKGVSK